MEDNYKINTLPRVTMLIVAIAALVFCVKMTPAYAAAETASNIVTDDGAADVAVEGDVVAYGEEPAATPATTSAPARRTRPQTTGVSLTDAASTAEKMYYCGELYIFADSMNKLNYEMAAIAVEMKEAIRSGALTKNRATLNAITRKYNALCETYNTWVDVKADLEYYIDKAGARLVLSKSQLQAAFKRTLKVINDAEDMLGVAQVYYEGPTTAGRRELNGAADALIASAANAVNLITPYAQAAISAYRSLFDQFAAQAGLKIEYKTWQNPDTQSSDTQSLNTQNPDTEPQ